jgi:thioredoxin 1
MKTLTTEEFKNKIESGEPFLVDMYADWCGPCRVLGPIVEKVSATLESQGSSVNIYKYNIESDRDFALEMGVRSIPTIKAFKGGQQVKNVTGVLQENAILEMANELVI